MTCEHGFVGACAVCDGSGQMPEEEVQDLCPECDGRGYKNDPLEAGRGYLADCDELCPACGGSGRREAPEDAYRNATQGV